MYVHFVCVCALDTGRELGVQQDFQKDVQSCLRKVLCTLRMRAVPRAGYIYLVLIADVNWILL